MLVSLFLEGTTPSCYRRSCVARKKTLFQVEQLNWERTILHN
jgi:hypothetical protein